MSPHIPLPRAAAEFEARSDGARPNYRSLYMAVVDGRLPAVQQNGRYYVTVDDLAAFGATMGLTLRADRAAA